VATNVDVNATGVFNPAFAVAAGLPAETTTVAGAGTVLEGAAGTAGRAGSPAAAGVGAGAAAEG
jgi:hypothetical protein